MPTSLEKPNIALIGYRGSGKTTIGRRLADRIKYGFVDTDKVIQQESGCTIIELFDLYGETGFRDRESRAVIHAAGQSSLVIALGGGAILDPANAAAIRKACRVIWLKADAATLWKRIRSDAQSAETRPPLSDLDGIQEVNAILSKREPQYEQSADVTIDANQSPDQILADVVEALS